MRVVIHDWEDDEAIAILKVCRRAMGENCKNCFSSNGWSRLQMKCRRQIRDLNMLVSPAGRSVRARNFRPPCQVRLRVDAGFFSAGTTM